MPHGCVIATIPATSAEVFSLLHDYGRRLEWDTLLQTAQLADHWTTAQIGATSICKGRWLLGGIAMKTQYISFNPPTVAAVRLVNRPPLFDTFAATIRHRDLGAGSSEIEYKYSFTARPRFLRWLLHPVMALAFRRETRKRLRSLAAFFEKRRSAVLAN